MLRISKPEEHSLRLVMRFARESGQQTLAELAHAERLPVPTVAKLLGRLRDAGLVHALRGRRGGYALAVAAPALTVADVLRALGAPLVSGHDCGATRHELEPCPRLSDCGLRAVWEHIEAQVAGVLEQVTIADLLQAEAQVHARVMALWPLPDAAPVPSPQGADV